MKQQKKRKGEKKKKHKNEGFSEQLGYKSVILKLDDLFIYLLCILCCNRTKGSHGVKGKWKRRGVKKGKVVLVDPQTSITLYMMYLAVLFRLPIPVCMQAVDVLCIHLISIIDSRIIFFRENQAFHDKRTSQ